MTRTIDLYRRGLIEVSPDALTGDADVVTLAENALTALPPLPFARLRTLDLGHNRLTTVAALPPITDFLYLHDNALVALPSLARQAALRYLNVSDNPLGALPGDLGALVALEELRADRCGLASLPPELGRLRRLRQLHLRGNAIADIRPLAALARLAFLDLRDNRLVAVDALAGLDALIALDLRGNPLAALPDAAWPHLDRLDLRWTPLASSPVADRLAARGCRVLH
jgi:Leucine-rich repeat (LRR) protein